MFYEYYFSCKFCQKCSFQNYVYVIERNYRSPDKESLKELKCEYNFNSVGYVVNSTCKRFGIKLCYKHTNIFADLFTQKRRISIQNPPIPLYMSPCEKKYRTEISVLYTFLRSISRYYIMKY